MKCYTHQVDSVGICKSCNKAVCCDCAIDTGRGLACSAACIKEVNDINIIMDQSKQMYGLNSDSKMLPTGIIMCFFFAFAFIGFGIYKVLANGSTNYFTFVMGLGFLFVAILAWHRNKKLNLHC